MLTATGYIGPPFICIPGDKFNAAFLSTALAVSCVLDATILYPRLNMTDLVFPPACGLA